MPTSLLPIVLEPGITTADSPYAAGKTLGYTAERIAKGRYTATTNVRFWAGWAEKRGGWVHIATTGATIRGIAREIRSWLGADNTVRQVIGASGGLFLLTGTVLSEITPYAYLVQIDKFVTIDITMNSTLVKITDTNIVAVGEWIFAKMASALDNVQLDGYYQVTSIVAGTSYTIQSNISASTTDSASKETQLQFPASLLGANPITTVNGQSNVTVDLSGLVLPYLPNAGDAVTISGATAVGGITLNGTFVVVSSTGTSMVVASGATASSGATGGGSAVLLRANASTGFAPSYACPGWTLAPYGNLMSACATGGTIYFYDPINAGRAYPVENAPTMVLAHFITPERFIVALGTTSSPLQLAWSDQVDPTDWTSLPTNTANSGRTLIGGAHFVGGIPVADGVSLILTDRCAFIMQYTGDNEVYSTPRVADNAGGSSPWGMTSIGQTAFWRGDRDFWMYNGSVSKIPSDDVQEQYFNNQNVSMINKSVVGTNRTFDEIWFFDVANGGTEVDRLAVFQTGLECWTDEQDDAGTPKPPLRTAWTDSDLTTYPLGVSAAGVIYMHENGVDADNGSGAVAMFNSMTTSMMDIPNGEATAAVTGYVPDMAGLNGTLDVQLVTQYYPGTIATTDATAPPLVQSGGHYNDRVDFRGDGKLFGLYFQSNALGDDWRIGQGRLEITPQGLRK